MSSQGNGLRLEVLKIMKVSEKQLLMLLDIAKDTLKISNPLGGYDMPTRLQLVNDVINQQSNDLKEIEIESKPKKKILKGNE